MAQSLRVARLNLYRPIPSDPSDWFDAEEIAQSRAYNRPLQMWSLATGAVTIAIVVASTVFRVPQHVIRALGSAAWPVQLLAVIAVLLAITEIATIPLDYWHRQHQKRWRMQVDTRRFAGARDFFEGVLLVLPFFAVIALPFWALVRATALWWLIAAGATYAVFILVSLFFVPRMVSVLGKVTPIDDEELRKRVRRVSREAGTAVIDVYQSDESKRSPRENALLVGVGKRRRLVLSDNLLARPYREIDVALARQISVIRRRRRLKLAIVLAFMTFVSFALLRVAVGWGPLLRFAGVRSAGDPASFPVVCTLLIGIAYYVQLAGAWIKRADSRVATLDALEFTRDNEAFVNFIHGTYINNRKELAPNWWSRVRSQVPTASEQLALGAWWQARRRVTVLFTDIEDSTALLGRLGDEGWYQLRRDHNEIIRQLVADHDGIEVDSAGDGFLIVFEDAGEALLCAVECQRALQQFADSGLRVRMGLHAGDVIRKGREVVGREVHVAARVASCASGGEILVSASVRDALQGTDRFTFSDDRDVELKGFTGTYTVWRVPWITAREPAST